MGKKRLVLNWNDRKRNDREKMRMNVNRNETK